MIYIYDITVEENEFLYGPGRRVVIWTQGCSIRCPGCTNVHLWSRQNAKKMTNSSIIQFIIDQPNIHGITLHGGEPADQHKSLLKVMKSCKERGLNIITFTGYEIEDFITKSEREFIELSDLVICGPFIMSKIDRYLHFRGSSNQRVIKMTDVFKDYEIQDGHNIVLLNIDENGTIINKGFPDEQMNQMLKEHATRK